MTLYQTKVYKTSKDIGNILVVMLALHTIAYWMLYFYVILPKWAERESSILLYRVSAALLVMFYRIVLYLFIIFSYYLFYFLTSFFFIYLFSFRSFLVFILFSFIVLKHSWVCNTMASTTWEKCLLDTDYYKCNLHTPTTLFVLLCWGMSCLIFNTSSLILSSARRFRRSRFVFQRSLMFFYLRWIRTGSFLALLPWHLNICLQIYIPHHE